MKAHGQINSVASKGVVSKLSYDAKGSVTITIDLGNNSFEVQQYDDPSSSKRKYKNTELYLLPSALFPSQPLDTVNQRYLNSTHASIVDPLKQLMRIEIYNKKWLRKPNSSTPTCSSIVENHCLTLMFVHSFLIPIYFLPSLPCTKKQIILLLCTMTSTPPPSVSKLSSSDTPDFVPSSVPNTSTNDVVQTLLQSRGKLCFIQYTPEGTLVRR